MAIEIVDFPIENGGSFHSSLYVYQRVMHTFGVFLFILFHAFSISVLVKLQAVLAIYIYIVVWR